MWRLLVRSLKKSIAEVAPSMLANCLKQNASAKTISILNNNSRVSARLSFSNCIRVDLMKTINKLALLGMSLSLFACSTPPSKFGVYQQSDGAVGVHAPKDAKEIEAQGMALAECQKMGKGTASIVESRKTVNDRFPYTYTYACR